MIIKLIKPKKMTTATYVLKAYAGEGCVTTNVSVCVGQVNPYCPNNGGTQNGFC